MRLFLFMALALFSIQAKAHHGSELTHLITAPEHAFAFFALLSVILVCAARVYKLMSKS